ncbi:protein YpmT [Litchfieldia alkalitelluris]|uniref:protein YpmT n=1 Tax=Litchfieldia alkalitelluris TaxID=304268 RepID=UPI000997D91B|nr:protein YpmT [Litchfieldia alkalitelluris]
MLNISYSPFLIILSIIIVIISSYTSLTLAQRFFRKDRSNKITWLFLGSIIWGLGIFSLHFIGIIAFHIDAPLSYNPYLLSISLFAAICSSFAAYFILYMQSLTKIKLIVSGLITGTSIMSMHFIGVKAIQEPVKIDFNSIYFSLSILIALIFSSIALKAFYKMKKEKQSSVFQNIVSALFLGTTVYLLHHIGMRAIVFIPHSHDEQTFLSTFLLGLIVPFVTLMIIIIGLIIAFLDYKSLKKERLILEQVAESEERYRRLVEFFPDAIIVHDGLSILYVNEAFLKLIHSSMKEEVLGYPVINFLDPDFFEVSKIQNLALIETQFLKTKTLDQKIKTLSGSTIDVEVTAVGIEFEGKPAIQLVIRDISEQKKTKRALHDSQQRYKSLFNYNPDAVYSVDKNGYITNINTSVEKLLGYSRDELSVITFHSVIDPDYLELTTEHFKMAYKGEPQYYETVGIHKNGSKVPLSVTNIPIIVDGIIIGVFGIAKDISKEKNALMLLEENEEKYRSLFDSNLDAVVEIGLDGYYKNVNKMAEKLTQLSKEELLVTHISSVINSDDLERAYRNLSEGKPAYDETTVKNKDGTITEMEVNVVPIRKHGNLDGVFAIIRDVTEKKQAQKRIEELAFTDQLTELPNRHWLYKNLEMILKRAQELRQTFAILTIDFDNFKGINDTLGHHAGDLFLKKVAKRLKRCIRTHDKIARLGGDEFIIILENINENEVYQLANEIIIEMNQPLLLQNQEILVTVSIGISFQTDSNTDAATLIKQADFAMYSAKEKGKNNFQFFTKELNDKVIRKVSLENALRKAIEQNEFSLFYQPQFDIRTENIVGVEALLRWNSSSFGHVSPAEFIPLAEETGLIIPIGEWVIKEACKQIRKWEKQALPKIRVSVNVSARQFKDPEFSSKFQKTVASENVDPQYLEIEITESVMINVEEASKIIGDLKKMGVKIAIDDFGAGYSSLNIISKVDIDTLKIDKSLIDNFMINSRKASILKASIGVGKSLKTNVIVEGIETKEQSEFLEEFEIIGQGYYYSRPLPAEQVEQLWIKYENR